MNIPSYDSLSARNKLLEASESVSISKKGITSSSKEERFSLIELFKEVLQDLEQLQEEGNIKEIGRSFFVSTRNNIQMLWENYNPNQTAAQEEDPSKLYEIINTRLEQLIPQSFLDWFPLMDLDMDLNNDHPFNFSGIFAHLELHDLLSLSKSSTRMLELVTPVAEGIAEKIGFVFPENTKPEDKFFTVRNYIESTWSLNKKSGYLLSPPEELKTILNEELTFEGLNKVQSWVKARDTIVVWSELVGQTQEPSPENGQSQLKMPEGIRPYNLHSYSCEATINYANGFSVWFKENIATLSSLEKLDLSKNRLQSLPPELWLLSSLNWLDLSVNNLQDIPKEIGKLSSLKCFFLHYNNLQRLPREIGMLSSLEMLYVFKNKLQSLPPEICKLSSLEDLNLIYNNLQSLPREIGLLSSLEKLWISNNNLQRLPRGIGVLSSLKELNISNNPFIKDDQFRNLIQQLRKKSIHVD